MPNCPSKRFFLNQFTLSLAGDKSDSFSTLLLTLGLGIVFKSPPNWNCFQVSAKLKGKLSLWWLVRLNILWYVIGDLYFFLWVVPDSSGFLFGCFVFSYWFGGILYIVKIKKPLDFHTYCKYFSKFLTSFLFFFFLP